jgi:hypothetical protein
MTRGSPAAAGIAATVKRVDSDATVRVLSIIATAPECPLDAIKRHPKAFEEKTSGAG